MVFIEQPKTEGEKKDCPSCDKPIVSRLKEYNDFPSKIQWQNKKETKAHYDKDGNCKDTTTNEPTETTQQTMESPKESTPDKKIPEISKDLEKFALKENTLLSQITKVVSEELQKALKSGEPVRGDVVWVRTKTIYTQWRLKNNA